MKKLYIWVKDDVKTDVKRHPVLIGVGFGLSIGIALCIVAVSVILGV